LLRTEKLTRSMRTVQANPLRHVVTEVLKDVRHPDGGACVL